MARKALIGGCFDTSLERFRLYLLGKGEHTFPFFLPRGLLIKNRQPNCFLLGISPAHTVLGMGKNVDVIARL